jgi:hypothetical protein
MLLIISIMGVIGIGVVLIRNRWEG